MLINKLADPNDMKQLRYKMIKAWCDNKVLEGFHGLKLPMTYSEHYRAWEYAQMFFNIPFDSKSKILDLGTSESIRPIWYWENGVKDYTTYDMAHVEERKKLYGHYCNGEIKVDQGDIHNLPYKDEEFDIVLSISVVEHLADPKKALAEMVRVCKHGGYIGLTTDFSDRPVDQHKSGREYNWETIDDIFFNTLRDLGCEMVGEKDMHNVDLNLEENRVVQGKYTFASIIHRKP